MANPAKPKDAKPKAEDEDFEIKQTEGSGSNSQGGMFQLLTLIAVVVAAIIIIVANYFMVEMKMAQMMNKINSIAANGEEVTGDEDESVAAERGIIIDLGEFILNLSDSNARKFLKVNVAIELSKKASDTVEAPSGGGHGHGEAAPDPMANIEAEMNQFKPSIRDSVISVLSAKTSEELATTPGKELAKEQIKEAIDAVFEGDREVLRVSFGSFFIQ